MNNPKPNEVMEASIVWDEPLCPKCDDTVLKTFCLEGKIVDQAFSVDFVCEKCGKKFKLWFIIRSEEKPGTETDGGCVEEAGILVYATKKERLSAIAKKAAETRKANQQKKPQEERKEELKPIKRDEVMGKILLELSLAKVRHGDKPQRTRSQMLKNLEALVIAGVEE